MDECDFRRKAFRAWLLPVGLFLVAPYLFVVVVSGADRMLDALLFLLLLLLPIAATGCLLAPWAGRNVPVSKGPAFIASAIAAVSPALVPFTDAAIGGSWRLGFGVVTFWALFALPASVIGALLFIGACERKALDLR